MDNLIGTLLHDYDEFLTASQDLDPSVKSMLIETEKDQADSDQSSSSSSEMSEIEVFGDVTEEQALLSIQYPVTCRAPNGFQDELACVGLHEPTQEPENRGPSEDDRPRVPQEEYLVRSRPLERFILAFRHQSAIN
jgi:hypothetical protein